MILNKNKTEKWSQHRGGGVSHSFFIIAHTMSSRYLWPSCNHIVHNEATFRSESVLNDYWQEKSTGFAIWIISGSSVCAAWFAFDSCNWHTAEPAGRGNGSLLFPNTKQPFIQGRELSYLTKKGPPSPTLLLLLLLLEQERTRGLSQFHIVCNSYWSVERTPSLLGYWHQGDRHSHSGEGWQQCQRSMPC